jgi:tetratricopeptide (TPR) repeat protein
MDLQKLVEKAGEMATRNIWGENAYKINMAILKLDHNNCPPYTRLAKYYKLNNNITEAKNIYLKVLDIDPKNRGAINNLYNFEKEEKETEFVEEIKTTMELLREGKNSMRKGKYTLAEKLFSKAYSMEPSLMCAGSLAGVYQKMGKYGMINKLHRQLIDANHIKEDVEAINDEFKKFGLHEKEKN